MPVPLLIMGKDASDNIPHITDLEELSQSEGVNMEVLGLRTRCAVASALPCVCGVIGLRTGAVRGDIRYHDTVDEFRFVGGTE